MKKQIVTILTAAIVLGAGMLSLPSSAAELCVSWSGEALNAGNTGGSSYADEEGGYRTLIHEVNTGVRPIQNFKTGDITPNGEDIYIRYKVKVLSDDETTAGDVNVFGFHQHIYGDGELINDEAADSLYFTAEEVRALDYDSDGWAYVYYNVSESRFSLSSYASISINNQVCYNGAKNSGCAIDMAIGEIAVFIGNPAAASDDTPTTPDPDTTDAPDTDDSPAVTDAPATTEQPDTTGGAESPNPPKTGDALIWIVAIAAVSTASAIFFIRKRKV